MIVGRRGRGIGAAHSPGSWGQRLAMGSNVCRFSMPALVAGMARPGHDPARAQRFEKLRRTNANIPTCGSRFVCHASRAKCGAAASRCQQW